MKLKYSAEVEIPELGLQGWTMFVYTDEHEAWWTVACENRAIVTVQQKKLVLAKSYSEDRGMLADDMKKTFGRAGLSS